jgi:pyruvate formate lyase activating enzyme
LRCWWCHNPESQRPEPEVVYFEDRCTRCGACVSACPEAALSMDRERVVRDTARCTLCLGCVAACRSGAGEAAGAAMGVDDVLARVCRDKPFYESSGGGVTITGGEPTAQPDFLLALLTALRDESIHTAIETCGHFPAELQIS